MSSADAKCPLCGAPSTPEFSTPDRNRKFTDVVFHYRRCHGCAVIFLDNVPDDLSDYYVPDYHRTPQASDLNRAARWEDYKLDFVLPHMPSGRLIDIGPSYGAFPYLARKAGYDVTAVEMDPGCCRFIEEVVGAHVVQTANPDEALESLPEADVITLWHSIEHLPQPWRTLEAAAKRLRPGGLLVVATPNPRGIQARLLEGRWAHIDAPRHLFLIPGSALGRRAAASGLSAVLVTSTDVGTRRCNRYGWERAFATMRFPDGGVLTGAAMELFARPLEGGWSRGSGYLALLTK